MIISNGQILKAAKMAKLCAKNNAKLIICAYFLLVLLLLAVFSARTAFYSLWHKNEEAAIVEDMKIDNELLQVIVEKIDSRDKIFFDVENLEFKNPFD